MDDIRYYEILVEDRHNYWRVVGCKQGYAEALYAASLIGKPTRVVPLPLGVRYTITEQGRTALKENAR